MALMEDPDGSLTTDTLFLDETKRWVNVNDDKLYCY